LEFDRRGRELRSVVGGTNCGAVAVAVRYGRGAVAVVHSVTHRERTNVSERTKEPSKARAVGASLRG